MELLELNKFSNLHNNKNIFFTKTEFLQEDFVEIENLRNGVILISGNSDYPINLFRMKNLPNNVIKWYAQNAIENHPKLEPLPIGLENKLECYRKNHGINHPEIAGKKHNFLQKNYDVKPTKKIYSNFNVMTNMNYRNNIKNICIKSKHIFWEEPTLTVEKFMERVLEFESVICPIGNGVDTHRIWEVLYLKRIPITIKVGNFKIYEMYNNLPIVVLENETDLLDEKLLTNKIDEVKNKKYNLDFLDFNFWKNKIIEDLKY